MNDGQSFLRNSFEKAGTNQSINNFEGILKPITDNKDHILEIKKRVKSILKDVYNTQMVTMQEDPMFRQQVTNTINHQLQNESLITTIEQRNNVLKLIIDDIFGYGAIQPLLDDNSITEIMVSRYDKIYVEKSGRMQLCTQIKFSSDQELREVIERICAPIGRTINDSRPIVDARLVDGSRVNATVPPISPDGCTLTIRKFSKHKLVGEDFINFGSLNNDMLMFLDACVKARLNIFVLGGTGTGKTTFLNMLSNFIPEDLSIITVEDSCELQLNQPNVRRLEAKMANSEGVGALGIRQLIINTLRMRPDIIVVGEIRDGSIVDLTRAASSGHDGTMSTLHTNSPEDFVESTVPVLFGMSDMSFTEDARNRLLCSSLDLMIQLKRYKDGTRKVDRITMILGYERNGAQKLGLQDYEKGKIYLQDLFRFKQTGMDNNGMVVGEFESTGFIPKDLIEKMEVNNIKIDKQIFVKKGRDIS